MPFTSTASGCQSGYVVESVLAWSNLGFGALKTTQLAMEDPWAYALDAGLQCKVIATSNIADRQFIQMVMIKAGECDGPTEVRCCHCCAAGVHAYTWMVLKAGRTP
jgi:hypothetical protein